MIKNVRSVTTPELLKIISDFCFEWDDSIDHAKEGYNLHSALSEPLDASMELHRRYFTPNGYSAVAVRYRWPFGITNDQWHDDYGVVLKRMIKIASDFKFPDDVKYETSSEQWKLFQMNEDILIVLSQLRWSYHSTAAIWALYKRPKFKVNAEEN